MFYLVQIIVPIFIIVILPVLIVWIVFRASINKDNKNAEIVIKAIENNSDIDADKLVEALSRPKKTIMEVLHLRLLRGCIFTLLGMAFLIFGICVANTNAPNQVYYGLFFLAGCSLAVGIAYLIVYYISRRDLSKANKNTSSTD